MLLRVRSHKLAWTQHFRACRWRLRKQRGDSAQHSSKGVKWCHPAQPSSHFPELGKFLFWEGNSNVFWNPYATMERSRTAVMELGEGEESNSPNFLTLYLNCLSCPERLNGTKRVPSPRVKTSQRKGDLDACSSASHLGSQDMEKAEVW